MSLPTRTAAVLALALATTAAAAQDASDGGALNLELNALQDNDSGCLLTFVAENALGTSIEKAAYEVVLFNGEGLVERLTVLDFQDLPEGRTRVRQFNLSETECGDVSRVLINDVSSCTGEAVEPAMCMDRLAVSSQSDVEFLN